MFNRRARLAEKADFSNDWVGGGDPDAPMAENPQERPRNQVKNEERSSIYKKGCEVNQSAFGKLLLSPRLTPASRLVLNWFVEHLGNKNYVGASYAKIAKSVKLSVASVRRGCAVLEDQGGLDFMVRVSKNTKSSLWLVNPEYFWKGFRSEYVAGKATYYNYRKPAKDDDDNQETDKSENDDLDESGMNEF